MKNIRLFQALVGKDKMANVVLVTTRWDLVQNEPKDLLDNRLKELTETDGFWGGMMAAGARHEALRDVAEDGKRILSSLLQLKPFEVKLQEQLRNGMNLDETEAGIEVSRAFEEMKKAHEEKIAGMQRDFEMACRQGNNVAMEGLMKIIQKQQDDMKAHEQHMRELHAATIASLLAQIDEIKTAHSQKKVFAFLCKLIFKL